MQCTITIPYCGIRSILGIPTDVKVLGASLTERGLNIDLRGDVIDLRAVPSFGRLYGPLPTDPFAHKVTDCTMTPSTFDADDHEALCS